MSDNVFPINPDIERIRRQYESLNNGGGGGNSGDMEHRISRLEAQYDSLAKDMSEVKSDVKAIHATMAARPALTEWQVARVMAAVLAFFMAAVYFGPRVIALIGG